MQWLNVFIQGSLLGGIYALFAIGLSLSFGIMRLVNIAHGDLIVLSAYVALVVGSGTGLDPISSLVVVVPVMFGLGYVLQAGLLNHTLSGGLLPPLLVTFGISVIIQNGLLQVLRRLYPPPAAGCDRDRESATSRRPLDRRLSAAGLRGGGGGHRLPPIALLPYRPGPRLSRCLRRCRYRRTDGHQQSPPLCIGICNCDDLHRGRRRSFAIRTNFDPAAGSIRLILAFEAVIIGGLGSMWGTLAGGMVLGIAQAVGAALSPTWQILAGHLAFLAILIVRPSGLFPRTRD